MPPVERPLAHSALVSPRPSLPRGVQQRLIDQRVRLLATLDGDFLDLSRPSARAAVLAAAGGRRPSERYSTIVSVAELIRFPDLALALTGLERLLADDGRLLLVEPVDHPGAAASLFATMWTVHPAVAQVHVERDLGPAVRAAGLEFRDLERFTMPTTVWPLRLFVRARAQRVTELVAS